MFLYLPGALTCLLWCVCVCVCYWSISVWCSCDCLCKGDARYNGASVLLGVYAACRRQHAAHLRVLPTDRSVRQLTSAQRHCHQPIPRHFLQSPIQI